MKATMAMCTFVHMDMPNIWQSVRGDEHSRRSTHRHKAAERALSSHKGAHLAGRVLDTHLGPESICDDMRFDSIPPNARLTHNRSPRDLFLCFKQSIQDTNHSSGRFANKLAVGFIANKSNPLVKPVRVKNKKRFADTLFPILPVRVQG